VAKTAKYAGDEAGVGAAQDERSVTAAQRARPVGIASKTNAAVTADAEAEDGAAFALGHSAHVGADARHGDAASETIRAALVT